ncbi:MAG: rhomboid family intramembrane serine protease [Chloroflexi bacterium]|nr:rhomboid family intramembrane serine protease [Chloroflexota bacterium]
MTLSPGPNPPDDRPVHPLERKPVHPLNRPPTPEPGEDGTPGPQIAKVEFAYNRPKRALVTLTLVGLNIAIFTLAFIAPALNQDLLLNAANQPTAVLDGGQYWRLFTSMFLHAGLAHVLLNMLALYSLGSVLEITFGHARFALIYLLGGLVGSVLSAALNAPITFSVGASGAVFAVFGAEAAHLYSNWRVMGPAARLRLRQVIMFAVLNFSIGFFGNLTGGGVFLIDNWAHVGGFVGGALLATLIGPLYRIEVDQVNTRVIVHDQRPLTRSVPVVIYFAAGLLALLVGAVVVR